MEAQKKEDILEEDITDRLIEQRQVLEKEETVLRPKYQNMEKQIELSEFVSIINAAKEIKLESEKFQMVRDQFRQVVTDTLDYELIFDQVDCRNKLEEYVSV
jgi:predicted metal-dependent hydrolase